MIGPISNTMIYSFFQQAFTVTRRGAEDTQTKARPPTLIEPTFSTHVGSHKLSVNKTSKDSDFTLSTEESASVATYCHFLPGRAFQAYSFFSLNTQFPSDALIKPMTIAKLQKKKKCKQERLAVQINKFFP